MDLAAIEAALVSAGIPPQLTNEVILSYSEAKRRFALGDHRPQAVEGGRFSEAVFRVLQHRATGGTYTPIGKSLPSVPTLLTTMENAPTTQGESIRLHIPRVLNVLYTIRNQRDPAHLADGIDPNLQDSSLVINSMNWVVAELLRVFNNIPPNQAQAIVDSLVVKDIPVIQEIDGQPVVLRDLPPRDRALLMLYRAGSTAGLDIDELAKQTMSNNRGNLRRTLLPLVKARLVLLHPQSGRYHITNLGIRDVEKRGIPNPT